MDARKREFPCIHVRGIRRDYVPTRRVVAAAQPPVPPRETPPPHDRHALPLASEASSPQQDPRIEGPRPSTTSPGSAPHCATTPDRHFHDASPTGGTPRPPTAHPREARRRTRRQSRQSASILLLQAPHTARACFPDRPWQCNAFLIDSPS